MPTIPTLAGNWLGYTPANPAAGSQTTTLNSATPKLAFGFVPDRNVTLTAFRHYVSTVTGTLAAGDLTLEIYDDAGNAMPNASLGAAANVSTLPTGAGWVDYAPAGLALTAGAMYWFVIACPNAASGRYVAVTYGGQDSAPAQRAGGSQIYYGTSRVIWNGTAWGSGYNDVCGWRAGFADGTFAGIPVSTHGPSADKAYGSNEVGARLVTPANGKLRVRGLMVPFTKGGSPTGGVKFRLYSGASTTPIAETAAIPAASAFRIAGNASAYFVDGSGNPVVVEVEPGTTLRATIADTAADSASNYFRPYDFTWDADAASQSLRPVGGTACKTVLSGGSFTDAPGSVVPFALLLASDSEFAATSGAAVAAGDLRAGVVVGSTTGTLALPTADKVLLGEGFGADGTEVTGTRRDAPADQVIAGTVYGPGDTITGTYDVTALTLGDLQAELNARSLTSAWAGSVALTTSTMKADIIRVNGTAVGESSVPGVLKVDVGYVGGEAATLADGTAQGGGPDTITLDADTAPSIDGSLVGRTIYLVENAGAGQWNVVTAYDGTTKVATVRDAWAVQPAAGTTYVLGDPAGTGATAAEVRTEMDTNSTKLVAIAARTGLIPDAPAAVGSAMTLDTTQAVPASNSAGTVGDALNAARAQGFGKWVLDDAATPPTLTLYAPDGTTPVRVFDLDSATAPKSRT